MNRRKSSPVQVLVQNLSARYVHPLAKIRDGRKRTHDSETPRLSFLLDFRVDAPTSRFEVLPFCRAVRPTARLNLVFLQLPVHVCGRRRLLPAFFVLFRGRRSLLSVFFVLFLLLLLHTGARAVGIPWRGLLLSARSYTQRRGGSVVRPHVLPQPARESARGVLGRQDLEQGAYTAIDEDHHGVDKRLGRPKGRNGVQQQKKKRSWQSRADVSKAFVLTIQGDQGWRTGTERTRLVSRDSLGVISSLAP